MRADEGNVVSGDAGRHPAHRPGLEKPVREPRSDQRQGERRVFVRADVGGKQRRGQPGIGVEPGLEHGGHLDRIPGDGHIFREERFALEARIPLHGGAEQPRGMSESCEDGTRQSIVGQCLGVERRLRVRRRRIKQAEAEDDDEVSAFDLQGAWAMIAVQQFLDQGKAVVERRRRVQATSSTAVAPTRVDIIQRYANPPGDMVFPLEYFHPIITVFELFKSEGPSEVTPN